ncbi:MAG: hypothetical protein HC882_07965 [Acidobacteria bacterium]|nr:hypothetical protein [Acidobacteriota bacterium]
MAEAIDQCRVVLVRLEGRPYAAEACGGSYVMWDVSEKLLESRRSVVLDRLPELELSDPLLGVRAALGQDDYEGALEEIRQVTAPLDRAQAVRLFARHFTTEEWVVEEELGGQ